jgi:cytoskeletal protein CcmA (bactofilin family)
MAQANDINTPAETVVGPSVKIQGDLNSEGDIRIEGAVAGKVKTSQSVHVGEAAKLNADIHAGNAIIAGEVQGNIKIASNLILLSTARITGDIACSILRVEDGAQFSGKCSMGGAPAANGNGSDKSKAKAEPEPES